MQVPYLIIITFHMPGINIQHTIYMATATASIKYLQTSLFTIQLFWVLLRFTALSAVNLYII